MMRRCSSIEAATYVSARAGRDYPQAVAAMRDLVGAISESEMREMNLQVDDLGRQPAVVAAEFLEAFAQRGSRKP